MTGVSGFLVMNRFIIVHTYNNLVEEGKAAPLLCPDDNIQLISMIDADTDSEDPVMWCTACDTKFRFGLDTWKQIEAVVKEHYDI